jgi:hypothetical protein
MADSGGRRSRRTPLRALAAALVLFVAIGIAIGDDVVLHNGRRLRGRVVREDDRAVVLDVKGLGEMTIERSTVREIVRSAEPEPEPAPNPAPAPVPAPAPEQKPPAQRPPVRAPSRAQQGQPADPGDPLQATRVWNVPAGRLRAAFASVAEQARLSLTVTPAAETLLAAANAAFSGREGESTLGALLHSLHMTPGGIKLAYRVRDGALEIGRPHEVDGAPAQTRGSGVFWPDFRGDAKDTCDPAGWRRPDLLELSIEGRDGHVAIRMKFAEDVQSLLAQKTPGGEQKGYDLADVFLDTDDDSTTGRAISWDENRTGWEFEVAVSTGFEARDNKGNTFTQWGNIQSIAGVHAILRTLATYSLRPMDSSGGVSVTDTRSKDRPEELTTMRGAEITALVPYAALGVKKGQRVRACFTDCLQPMMTPARIASPGVFTLE